MRKLLTTEEAAPFAGVAAKTLHNWRPLGIGPAFIRCGGKIMYDPADIESWKARQRCQSTSEMAA